MRVVQVIPAVMSGARLPAAGGGEGQGEGVRGPEATPQLPAPLPSPMPLPRDLSLGAPSLPQAAGA